MVSKQMCLKTISEVSYAEFYEESENHNILADNSSQFQNNCNFIAKFNRFFSSGLPKKLKIHEKMYFWVKNTIGFMILFPKITP